MTDIITFLLSTIGTIISILGFIITDIMIIVQIILNPWLFLMIILTICNFYAAITAKTRYELISNYFAGIRMFANACYSVIINIIPVCMGVIQSMFTLLQGILAAPPIMILGNSIGVGTILAAGLILLVASSLFSGLASLDLMNWIKDIINDVANWF